MDKKRHYLRLARIEQEKRDLETQGYKVSEASASKDTGFDLVAESKKERIAIQIKWPSELPQDPLDFKKLRKLAADRGFDDFRLIVVRLPREKSIEIENLETTLWDHMANLDPYDFSGLPGSVTLEEVSDIDIDSITVDESGIHIVGDATVSVDMAVGGGEAKDGVNWSDSYPLEFDLVLDSTTLKIDSINSLNVDCSSFYE
jgi:hypothetical protein